MIERTAVRSYSKGPGTAPDRGREMRRRAAVEPVIGRIKAEHRMGRSYLTKDATATAPMPCSPLLVTTSGCSRVGPLCFCMP
jgi:hypothetical protein